MNYNTPTRIMHRFALLGIIYLLLTAQLSMASVSQSPQPKPTNPRLPPPPMIAPGAYLDTSLNSLPEQSLTIGRAAPAWLRAQTTGTPMYVVDGKSATETQLRRLKQADVASVHTLDGTRAAAFYGKNARRGLVIITTKAGIAPRP